jgi:hypothetical protein
MGDWLDLPTGVTVTDYLDSSGSIPPIGFVFTDLRV